MLLPVFLRLAGSAAWYLPAWLDRVVPDIHFGHGPAQPHTHGRLESTTFAEEGVD